ncbi:MAG: glycosyltransferase family 2 protein [Bacteroidota bacterium]
MISVIVPLYNKATFVEATIDSVLNQVFTNFELLVINDGSTDGSEQVVQAIEDPRLRLIHIEHSGVSEARNKGIRESKYEWVAFLDADDWWDENFLQAMVDVISAFPGQKLFASGRTHVFTDELKRYDNALLPNDGEVGMVNFFEVIGNHLPLINSSNAIIQKDHLLASGVFRPGQKKHEDHDLWIRLCLGEEVVFLNRNLSFYRNTESNSASNQHYEPADFSLFLNTLHETGDRLNASEKKHFINYCNRFVLYTYIKNYKSYNKHEDRNVVVLARKVMSGPKKTLLNFLHWFPFKGTYGFFRLLKRK